MAKGDRMSASDVAATAAKTELDAALRKQKLKQPLSKEEAGLLVEMQKRKNDAMTLLKTIIPDQEQRKRVGGPLFHLFAGTHYLPAAVKALFDHVQTHGRFGGASRLTISSEDVPKELPRSREVEIFYTSVVHAATLILAENESAIESLNEALKQWVQTIEPTATMAVSKMASKDKYFVELSVTK